MLTLLINFLLARNKTESCAQQAKKRHVRCKREKNALKCINNVVLLFSEKEPLQYIQQETKSFMAEALHPAVSIQEYIQIIHIM